MSATIIPIRPIETCATCLHRDKEGHCRQQHRWVPSNYVCTVWSALRGFSGRNFISIKKGD